MSANVISAKACEQPGIGSSIIKANVLRWPIHFIQTSNIATIKKTTKTFSEWLNVNPI